MIKVFKAKILKSECWRIYRRTKIAYRYLQSPLVGMLKWIPLKTEEDNFYYGLQNSNLLTLASTLSIATNTSREKISGYLDEILNDIELQNYIKEFFKNDPLMRDSTYGWGRRIGWYAAVRAMRPRLVVETGVHHGIGACVIAAALQRNTAEGNRGSYLGTDYNANAGKLFTERYSSLGKIVYGDSIESLRRIPDEIDLFINDSDHSESYEASEYEAIKFKLSDSAIIFGDNSHVTSALQDFSIQTGRNFLFFKEVPLDHWYPGGGIGISFPSRN